MERNNNKELYDRLGVTPDATQDKLKKAYRIAARKLLHASHGDSKENEEYFKNAAEAYNILSDKQLRCIYDREGLRGVHNFQQEEKERRNLDNLWKYGPPLGPRTPLKNPESKYTIHATLEDMYFGSVKQLNFTRRVICPSCKGSGASALSSAELNDSESPCSICTGNQTIEVSDTLPVNIPRGCGNRFALLMSGRGSQDNPKLAPGNLIVTVKQIDHPTFKRQESNLILDVSLPLAQFTNGFEITFQHLGRYVVVGKSEPNIALYDGSIFRLRGEGMPKEHRRGDLFLRFHESDSKEVFIGNKIELIHEMPCETETRHVTAEQVDEIPEDAEGPQCAQQ